MPMAATVATVSVLAQALGPGDDALALLVGLASLVYLVLLVWGAIWIGRDAKRRGENTALWVVLFVLAGLFFLPIGGFILLTIYLLSRHPTVKYDDQGHLLVPPHPPADLPAQPATWQEVPAPSAAMPVPAPVPAPVPPPAMAPVAAPMSKVRCPTCQSVFGYQKAMAGLTHVKCPACGQEGNI